MMMDPAAISLDDKYGLEPTSALIAGRQALVRLPIVQRELDRRHGLNTAGYISGYRGSPLGGYDAELWKAASILTQHDIVFAPGLNEDLALSAVAGTQQLDFMPGRKVDGVFGLWYGKGPGVDRSGDAIKHANLAGTAALGGVVLIFGDDHAGKSSTTSHQSDLTLASWGVPVLYPSSASEILDFGLAAIAMSRFSGLLIGLKLVNETAESTGILKLDRLPEFTLPEMDEPVGGVHIRPEVLATQRQEARLHLHKLPRAQAFAQANNLDRITYGAAASRFLIVTAGKAYTDVLDALALLGLDQGMAESFGIGVYKVGLIFPLAPEAFETAAHAAEELFFVEEKLPHVEREAKLLLFDRRERPRISGKTTPEGQPLLPLAGMLNGAIVAAALADRLVAAIPDVLSALPRFAEAREALRERDVSTSTKPPPAIRRPAFCPGCPHNMSTRVPEGAIGSSGIGCHSMVVFHPERNPIPMGHMGAEGANWIGLSNFTETSHIFQNLGDGTYNHSGSLAIRAAVQSNTSITYKILFNDAVAMTGGQPLEGGLTVSQIARQVQAEGVTRVVVLSEDPGRFADEPLPAGTVLRHRDALAEAQDDLRRHLGVSVLIYDQVCAAEKRRRRKIGTFPQAAARVFINDLVCEGCGDCSVQSSCLAIQPLETKLGLKRKIDQSACNNDLSCVNGFCPSFVTVRGGRPRRAIIEREDDEPVLPEPKLPAIGATFDLLIAGIGGTGVVTVGAILGMAARIEGLGVNLFDMTGLSQKGGAVFSHVRISRDAGAVIAAKVGPGMASVVIACDLVAATQPECLETMGPGTLIAANTDVMATAAFQADRDNIPDPDALIARIANVVAHDLHLIAATSQAEALFGDSIAANLMMLGFVWQLGGVPLPLSAIEQAITLNGKAVASNLRAFAAGRRAVVATSSALEAPETLETFVAARATDLESYWNASYARRYMELIAAIRPTIADTEGGEALIWAIARSAYRLMAYKDEYEVARLYADGRFRAALDREFEDIGAIEVYLAPPLVARIDTLTGRPRKIRFGVWVFRAFGVLARLRGLREGPFDIFGRSADRRLERDLRDAYLAAAPGIAVMVEREGLDGALSLVSAPLDVRGYGPVKGPTARALLARLKAYQQG